MINRIRFLVDELENTEMTIGQNICYHKLVDVVEGRRNIDEDIVELALSILEELADSSHQ